MKQIGDKEAKEIAKILETHKTQENLPEEKKSYTDEELKRFEDHFKGLDDCLPKEIIKFKLPLGTNKLEIK